MINNKSVHYSLLNSEEGFVDDLLDVLFEEEYKEK
jgi:hypothetical protein